MIAPTSPPGRTLHECILQGDNVLPVPFQRFQKGGEVGAPPRIVMVTNAPDTWWDWPQNRKLARHPGHIVGADEWIPEPAGGNDIDAELRQQRNSGFIKGIAGSDPNAGFY